MFRKLLCVECSTNAYLFEILGTNNFGVRNFLQFVLEVDVGFFLISSIDGNKPTYLSRVSKIVSPIFLSSAYLLQNLQGARAKINFSNQFSTTHLPTPLFPSLPLQQQCPQIFTMDSPSTAAVHVSGTMKVLFNGFAGLSAERNQVQTSTEFTCLGCPWQIRIYPGGKHISDEGMVSVSLHNLSGKSINIEYTLSIKKNNHVVAPTSRHKVARHQCWGFPNFGMRSKILESLEDGALIIEVHMKLIDQTKPSPFIPANPSACKVIQAMFMDEESANVVIEVEGEGGQQLERNAKKNAKTNAVTFYAHRAILKKCSTTLADLCESEAGDKTAPVQISDVSPGIFCHLLNCMYGGGVSDDEMKLHAKEIIDAADKYGVVNLKLEAEVHYVEATTFTIENVMDVLLYAESKNCTLLKEAALDFIAENKIEAMNKLSFTDVPGTLMRDLLATWAREDIKQSTTVGNHENELTTMRISELCQKAHLRRLNVDGSREMLITSLKKKQRKI